MESDQQGEIVRKHRTARHWTVRRLAREAKLSASYLSLMESGQRPVTARALGRIADALGLRTYDLLAEGGFIPMDHLAEATRMAALAMKVPSIYDKARGSEQTERLDWLIVDYLYLLGDDPYGTGFDGGPGGNHADWSPLVPASPIPLPERLLHELAAMREAQQPPTAPTPIEGWDDLSEADQHFVQQMVNKLRRPTTGE
jgi:transcriptional regulator with XRE-family HTH domain